MNERFRQAIKAISLEDVIIRLLSAWAMMGIFQNLRVRDGVKFTTNTFFEKYNFFACVVVFVFFFAMLWIKILKKHQKKILWLSFFVLFLRTLWQRTEFGYYMGAVAVMVVLSVYALHDVELKKDISKPLMWGIISPFALVVVGTILTVTILMYKAFWTPTYDFGIFSQMFYYMKETLLPLSTCERDTLLSHFAVHFSPVFYLILPVYFIFPSPITLLVCQGLISLSGVVPLYLLCKKYKQTNLCTAFLCLCYVGSPALTGGNLYYLHENVFLTPLLLWLFYFCDKKKYVPSLVFATLTMLVKEDAPIYVIIFGLYLLLSKKDKKLGTILISVATVYFVTAVGLLKTFGLGVMSNRFDNFNKTGEATNLVGVIMTAFSNPAYVISEMFENDRIMFLLQLFIPLGFVPFFTKKLSRYILLLPMVVINLLSDYGYQHDMSYQYVFGTLAFVIYLCVINSADVEITKRTKYLFVCGISSVMVFVSMYYSRLEVVESYKNNMDEHRAMAQAIELIPEDASVSATTFLVSNLSQRDEVYELESTKNVTDYYVLDLRYPTEQFSVEDYENENFQTVYKDKFIAIFKRNQ